MVSFVMHHILRLLQRNWVVNKGWWFSKKAAFLASYVVWHLIGNLQRELHEARYLA